MTGTRVPAARLALLALTIVLTPFLLVIAQPTDPLTPPANGPRRTEVGWSALVNATVHPRPGEAIEHATVVLRDGRIAAVLTPGEGVVEAPAAPAGVTPFDCTGLHVYAGLIEPFLEVDAPQPEADAPGVHWNRRVTPQRSALDGTGVDARTSKSLRDLGFTAAAISPRGGNFRGSVAVVSLAEAMSDPSRERPPVYARDVFQTVSFDQARGFGGDEDDGDGGVRWSNYPNSQMGAIALIRQTLSDAEWRSETGGTGTRFNGAAAPSCLDALAPAGSGEDGTRLLFDVTDELEVLRASKIAKEFNRRAVIVGSGTEFRRLEAIAEQRWPMIVPLAFPEAPKVASIGAADEVSLRDLMTWEQAPTNPRRLEAAGVMTVALTTSKLTPSRGGRGGGGGPPAVTPGPRTGRGGAAAGGVGGEGGRSKFRDNLRTAIRYGLSEDKALAMLTTNPAEIIGVADQLGTIEAGKRANLTVVDGPLFAKKTKVREVWIDGRRHEITPAPTAFEGTWDVTLDPPPAAAGAIQWLIEKEGTGGLTVTIFKTTEADGEKKEQRAKARSIKVDDAAGGQGRIAFLLDHEPFGQPGVFTISGVLERSPAVAMRGNGTRADGAMFSWSAAPAKEGRREGGNRQQAAGNREDDEGGEARADERPRRGRGGPGGDESDADEKAPTDIPEALGYPFGALSLPSMPEQPEAVVITGATIWTSGPAGKIDNGTLVIQKGKITHVGAGSPPGGLPEGAVPIDARGKHITPGLIDCHSHTGISKGVNESGQAVTAEVRIEDVTNPDSVNWYRELAGGVTTVNNLHGSANPIGGQNCVNKIRWGVTHPDQMHFEGAKPGIKFALGENVKQSSSSTPTSRYPRTRMGVEALIRERFTAARDYAAVRKQQAAAAAQDEAPGGATSGPASPSVPVRRDLELETLAEILEGKRLIHCHSYRQDEILMLARLSHEFGFRLGTYQHGLECYKVADVVKEAAIGASIFADWWAYKVEVQDAIPAAGPILHDAGVIVSYNSDSDELARRLNVEAAKAMKYGGLPPEEALKFITINPAKQLMIDGRVGSLEVGKDADLAIWSGPPLSSLSRCEQTWVDGRCYFSLERDKELRERDGKERQRLIQKILAEGAKRSRGGRGGDRPGGGGGDDAKPADPAPADAPPTVDVSSTSGRRSFLLYESLRRSQDLRREMYLDYVRRGLDPETAKCGQCGDLLSEEMGR